MANEMFWKQTSPIKHTGITFGFLKLVWKILLYHYRLMATQMWLIETYFDCSNTDH